ncbi:hypothetical protein TIFTF001_012377 [Ficus carica]|uniref:Uncharacterized protein n=1 Tax=Ficus carica TaxID=3494 RepID=A0AA88A1L1_FICCA|nr:hypothetical protein TIFTF001_012377 [Ficus carica]
MPAGGHSTGSFRRADQLPTSLVDVVKAAETTTMGADYDDFSRSSEIDGGLPAFHRQQSWRTKSEAGTTTPTAMRMESLGWFAVFSVAILPCRSSRSTRLRRRRSCYWRRTVTAARPSGDLGEDSDERERGGRERREKEEIEY